MFKATTWPALFLVGVRFQPWILADEQSLSQTRIAATASVFVVRADEKLTAFVGPEAEIRAALA